MRRAELAHCYAAALRAYLKAPEESALQGAYELGRRTLACGLGIMELAQAHSAATLKVLAATDCAKERERLGNLSASFFRECLWPFEVMHRGFLETNRSLRHVNAALESRARQLAQTNAELEKEMTERRRVEQALRQVSSQVLSAQEAERKRISRELHDEVGQALTAIHMNLALLRKTPLSRAAAETVSDLQEVLRETMETIHNVTRELRPAMLDHLGLVPALRAYVRNFGKRTGLRVRLSAVPEVESLGMEAKTVLYRVTQEGLNNVAKHARATQALVSIRRRNGMICMEVQDDGRTFQRQKQKGNSGLGLLGIRERVHLVNGAFSFKSDAAKGTTIRVEIPFKFSGTNPN